MNITKQYITKNRCYNDGRQITNLKGFFLHSIGCAQPKAQVLINNENKSTADAAVHAFIDGLTGEVYQCLPWTKRGWHAGSPANDYYIGVEMCEPDSITYTGGATWKDQNPARTREIVMRTYNSAVQLFAYLCKEFKKNPLEDGVILSHSEGNLRGIATAHADVEHIWNKMGLTMDGFRRDVNAAMNGNAETDVPQPTGQMYRVRKSWEAGYAGQIGAFEDLNKAKKMADDNPGYTVYDASGKAVYPQNGSFQVRVTVKDLRIRKTPSTGGVFVRYIEPGKYTITETVSSGGYTWGRLKSGIGWIALEYTERV